MFCRFVEQALTRLGMKQYVTLSGKSSLILGENKAGCFCRECHNYFEIIIITMRPNLTIMIHKGQLGHWRSRSCLRVT